jgi:hypothetical protein
VIVKGVSGILPHIFIPSGDCFLCISSLAVHLFGGLGHGVKGRAVLEPLNLTLVEGVRERDVEGLAAISGVDNKGDGLANGELSALDVNTVVGANLLVVGGLREGEGKHTLLLQVGLVDTSEGAGDDGKTTKVPGLESSVLTGRTLAVVPVTNDDPLDAVLLVVTGNIGDGTVLAVERVLDLVGLTVLSVDGTDQHVVGDVVQVSTVLQPGTGHGDVISGGLALALDEDGQVGGVLAVPGIEGRQELETVRGGRNGDRDRRAVSGGSLVGVLAGVVAAGGESLASGLLEHELLAVGIFQGVLERIKVQGTSDGHGNDQIGRGDEGVGGGVGVVAASEVTVVRRNDGVGSALGDIAAVPLSCKELALQADNCM